MTLRRLCEERTALGEEDILFLERYESTLPALSDLVGGDTFIDCMGKDGVVFVAAQAGPHHIPSAYGTQILGLPASQSNEPAVYLAFRDGMPSHDTVANTQLNRTVLQDVTPLLRGGRVVAVLIAEHDVTVQFRMEKKYRAISDALLSESMRDSATPESGAPAVASPAEPAFTVRESNHRIKNDLQLIASVCGIKARNAAPGAERNAYSECAAMVMTVAQLHTFFTDLGGTNRLLDVGLLLQRMADSLRAGVLGYCGATLVIDSDSVSVSPDIAVSLALCVNELILNALKYAFPEGGGTITVRVRSGNSFCAVLVSDDGDGCDTFRPGTGLTLVRDTVRDKLHGEFTLTSGSEGTKASFTFPLL